MGAKELSTKIHLSGVETSGKANESIKQSH